MIRPCGNDDAVPDPNDPTRMVISAGANGRCDTRANNTNIPPPNLPNAATLQNYLNITTWGRQSNIYFTVTVGQPFTVNFDLDRNGLINYPTATDWAELDAISRYRSDPNAYDLYYVGLRFTNNANGDTPAAVAENRDGFAWFGLDGLSNLAAAHELGHLLGRTNPAHSPVGSDYEKDLMYPSITGANQCRVRRPDWIQVNQ